MTKMKRKDDVKRGGARPAGLRSRTSELALENPGDKVEKDEVSRMQMSAARCFGQH